MVGGDAIGRDARRMLGKSGRADGRADVHLRLPPRAAGVRRGLRGLRGQDVLLTRADIYELTSDHRALPPPLAPEPALFISGVNRSDDLFMFFKGPVDGLSPGARYDVTVSVEIATDVPAGCVGVGGAPGESVWVKVGATAVEPVPVRHGTYLRMNIDVGNQSAGGSEGVVLGNVANSRRCEQSRQWERKVVRGETGAGIDTRYPPVVGLGCSSALTRDSRPGREFTSSGRKPRSRRCDSP